MRRTVQRVVRSIWNSVAGVQGGSDHSADRGGGWDHGSRGNAGVRAREPLFVCDWDLVADRRVLDVPAHHIDDYLCLFELNRSFPGGIHRSQSVETPSNGVRDGDCRSLVAAVFRGESDGYRPGHFAVAEFGALFVADCRDDGLHLSPGRENGGTNPVGGDCRARGEDFAAQRRQ